MPFPWEGLIIAAGLVVTVFLARIVIRSIRRLDRRIEEFRVEQEQNPGPPPNPWQALAELYAEDERKNEEARKRRGR